MIEKELDNTEPNSPFRTSRQKLNREKKRILRIMERRDPRWFAGVGKGGIPEEKMDLYLIKKVIVNILEKIEGGNSD